MKNKDEIVRLIRKVEGMEFGSAKLAAALHAKALADENGDPWCRIASCYFLAWSYLMTDDDAKAFPYCAEFFQLTEQYPQNTIGPVFALSLAEQAVYIALCLPQIPKEQCKGLLDQFESLSKRYNLGKKAFYRIAFQYYRTMGLEEEAYPNFERFQKTEADALRDCVGCNTGSEALALLDLNRRDEAIQTVEPLLTGAQRCRHGIHPRSILVSLLEYDLDNGNMEAAAIWATRLSRMGFKELGDLSDLGVLLRYRGMTEPWHSLRLLEKGITWSVGTLDAEVLNDFYKGAWILCSSLAEKHEKINLKLSQKFPLYEEEGEYETKRLAEWFFSKAWEIGQKFDRRNGTDRYAKKLKKMEKEQVKNGRQNQ